MSGRCKVRGKVRGKLVKCDRAKGHAGRHVEWTVAGPIGWEVGQCRP